MKHSILFTTAFALILLFSCDQKTINTANHADGINFNDRNWQEIDDWYINYFKGTEVTEHDVHLKIKTISSLLYQEDSKFSREASKEKKLFYGQELIDAPAIDEHVVLIADMLETSYPKSKEVAQLANEAYEKIAAIHSSANTINQLSEQEEKAMKSLWLLQHDRWGQPIIENASEPIIKEG